jgi:hypothetical protein
MPVQVQAHKVAFEDFLPFLIYDLAPDLALLSLGLCNLRMGGHPVSYGNGLEETGLGSQEDDERIVHGNHRRVIR